MMNEQNMNHQNTVDKIISFTEQLIKFWKSAEGWAPIDAASILSKSRLDWQLSLTKQLNLYITQEDNKEEGLLILGWTTIGSLVEGLLKLYLSVYYNDYKADIEAIKDSKGKLMDPDILMLEKLKTFFKSKIFPKWIRDQWKTEHKVDWIDWIEDIQQKRNAIHAFKHREIGDFEELYSSIGKYYVFLKLISRQLPYPDEIYEPR